ncbi:MAG: sulfatase-like hydrolase/transferase, partial [Acidobacteria bacterium]|nr:sulfatase-like hydrolase/transferase [Acidobacteriota bacterium]
MNQEVPFPLARCRKADSSSASPPQNDNLVSCSTLTHLKSQQLARGGKHVIGLGQDGPFQRGLVSAESVERGLEGESCPVEQTLQRSYRDSFLMGDLLRGSAQVILLPENALVDIPEVREDLAELEASVSCVDLAFGEILKGLESAGMADNTIIVFTADHGESLMQRDYWTHGLFVYEEEVRVPLILRWPGHIPAGRVHREPVELVDLAPTLLEFAGATLVDVGDDDGTTADDLRAA